MLEFNKLQEHRSKQLNKIRGKKYEENKKFNIAIETIKKTNILGLKNTIAELKNWIETFKSRLNYAKERISNLDNRYYPTRGSERKIRIRKNKESLRDSWDTMKRNSIGVMGIPEGKTKRECIFKAIMFENFLNLKREIDIQIH